MDSSGNKDKTEYFFEQSKKMMANSKMHEDGEITPDNIYQVAHKENRDLLFDVVKIGHLDGSKILGAENLIELYELAQQGHSCIILSEHVSNLDVPSMFVRFYDDENEKLKNIFEKLIFIAGVKLNQTPIVKLYTEMFSRVVIYPIRSMSGKLDKEEHKEEIELAKRINLRATRKIGELRKKGNIFVMYPAGTRYRPWDEDSKKGIKGAASYLSSFEYFLCSAINGNNMVPEQHEDMTKERFVEDVMVYSFGKVQKTKDYTNAITEGKSHTTKEEKDTIKQIIVNNVMSDLDKIHNNSEEYRKKFL